MKSTTVEAHLKAITIEHDASKKAALDLAEQLEDLKIKHSLLEKENIEKAKEHEITQEELQKYRQESEVLKIKSETVEAHLKSITIEHDESKKVAVDLAEQLEDLKMKHSLLEKDNIDKATERGQTQEELHKYRQVNKVLEIKCETLEAHLKAI